MNFSLSSVLHVGGSILSAFGLTALAVPDMGDWILLFPVGVVCIVFGVLEDRKIRERYLDADANRKAFADDLAAYQAKKVDTAE